MPSDPEEYWESCMSCFGHGVDANGDECTECRGGGVVPSPSFGEGEIE